MTYKERLVAGLLALGYKKVVADTRKYEVYEGLDGVTGQRRRLFVGPYGALRGGRSPSDSASHGCPAGFQDAFYKRVLETGDKVLELVRSGGLKALTWGEVEA